MQLEQDEKPFGSFFGISLWMRSVSLRGGWDASAEAVQR